MEEKLNKMIKRLNFYNLFDITVIVAFVLLLIAISEKTSIKLKHAIIYGLCSVVVAGGIATSRKSKVTNWSGRPIYVKSEEDGSVIEVKDGETYYGADGVRSYNTVYKFGDGMSAVVNKDGSLTVQSITGGIITHFRKCALASPPDPGWNDLFKIPCHEWKFKEEEKALN